MQRRHGELMRCWTLAGWLALGLGLLLTAAEALAQLPKNPQIMQSPGQAQPAAEAHAPVVSACDQRGDALSRVMCSGKLRLGVRTDYPPYGSRQDGTLYGFEVDLGRELARRLGVAPDFSVVTAANRIALLGEGQIDLTIATMGHTLQRDREVLFVRPHYYLSQTVVLGRKEFELHGLDTIRGKTVCVTVGNNTNAELSANGAHLMLFDTALRLVDALRQGGCSLVAQDDSFFAAYLHQPAFAAAYDIKFGFAPLPWGMAVAREGGDRLAASLGLALQQMHADGSLEALAKKHGADSDFLSTQHQLWSRGPCARPMAAGASPEAGCLLPPRDSQLVPTSFAAAVDALEKRIRDASGIKVTLAMFKSQVALGLFLDGIYFSLVLVSGAVAATFVLALLFGAALSSRHALVRWPMRCLLWVMQSTPMILLMILAGVVISAFGAITPLSALAGAIVVLGIFNGSNAGQAVAEAMVSLRAESPRQPVPLSAAVRRSSAQMVAFVVNATRGSPAASVIGVPELLSALTDIASFSSERITTYSLLLVFYMLVVALVVWLGHAWQARLARHETGDNGGGLQRA